MNLNYTCICLYCEEIYQSNRSTSKYCCKNHNSLYALNGPLLNKTILNIEGGYVNYNTVLSNIYKVLEVGDGWSNYLNILGIRDTYKYVGPLPIGQELLVVSGYLIRKSSESPMALYYAVKPIQDLTKQEKASCTIIAGGLNDMFNDLPENYARKNGVSSFSV